MELENEVPLYSSRITNTYIEYLARHYPHIDIDAILKYAKMTRYEVEDPGHWFTQSQVDRFHEKVVMETESIDISRKVGRSVALAESTGAVRQYGLGLMSPLTLYLMVGNFYNIMTKAATASAKKLGPNKVEIVVTPKSSTNEKPYQCENRKGTFESLAKPFTEKFASIKEFKCYHKGDDCCHYMIEWFSSPIIHLKRLRNVAIVTGLLLSIILCFFLKTSSWLAFSSVSVAICALLSFRTEYLEKVNLSHTIEVQGNAAKELVEEIDIRHNHALLVQKIGQITATIVDIDQLMTSVMDIIKAHLDFDRGLILLATDDKQQLYYQCGYRHSEPEYTFLQNLTIDLEKTPDDEILAKAFNNQQPYLINDVPEYSRTNDLDLSFFENLGSLAVVCIPIIFKKQSLGIIALDNTRSKRTLAKSDMSLLIGIASQIALGINNTISFNRLEKNKKELQLSRDELELRVEKRTAKLKHLNRELRLEVKEKEILMREVYHRVKNNLQIIASLLDMTKRRAQHPETRDKLSEAHAKIYTMSLIHTQLYQSDRIGQINMGRNLHNLVEHLAQLYSQNRFVTPTIDTESFYLSVTQAVPCALALNEIISNAYKYAYPGQQTGKIEISQKISPDNLVSIVVKDYGKGIPESIDIENTDTLGIKLIRNLIVRQLNGDLVINNRQGTKVTIRFEARFE